MKVIAKEIFISIAATLVMAVVVCGFYPLVVLGAGKLLFPQQARGSLLETSDHRVIGSALLGQNFTGRQYFHPRPSAAGATGYDATSSGGSNLGPTSQKLVDAVKERAAAYRLENQLAVDVLIPGDAVTASASGLDPHISPKNALLQAPRVARERKLPLEKVRALIEQHTAQRQLGFLGEPGVNVLTLNLALDGVTTSLQ